MTPPGPDTPEFSDSDREWFAALSGETPSADHARHIRQALALRTALAQRQNEIDRAFDGDAEVDAAKSAGTPMDEQLERLLARADAEGVFDRSSPSAQAAPSDDAATPTPTPPPSNVVEFPWWRRRRALVGLAASLIVGVLLVSRIEQTVYPLPPETHGADGIQRTRAGRARDAAERLAAGLRDAGLKAGLYQRGKTFVVDVTLMDAERAAAAPAFRALGLEPAVGFNRIEISPA